MMVGVNVLANAVKVTLGPAATSCSSALRRAHDHQGRRVGRKEIELKDKFENMARRW